MAKVVSQNDIADIIRTNIEQTQDILKAISNLVSNSNMYMSANFVNSVKIYNKNIRIVLGKNGIIKTIVEGIQIMSDPSVAKKSFSSKMILRSLRELSQVFSYISFVGNQGLFGRAAIENFKGFAKALEEMLKVMNVIKAADFSMKSLISLSIARIYVKRLVGLVKYAASIMDILRGAASNISVDVIKSAIESIQAIFDSINVIKVKPSALIKMMLMRIVLKIITKFVVSLNKLIEHLVDMSKAVIGLLLLSRAIILISMIMEMMNKTRITLKTIIKIRIVDFVIERLIDLTSKIAQFSKMYMSLLNSMAVLSMMYIMTYLLYNTINLIQFIKFRTLIMAGIKVRLIKRTIHRLLNMFIDITGDDVKEKLTKMFYATLALGMLTVSLTLVQMLINQIDMMSKNKARKKIKYINGFFDDIVDLVNTLAKVGKLDWYVVKSTAIVMLSFAQLNVAFLSVAAGMAAVLAARLTIYITISLFEYMIKKFDVLNKFASIIDTSIDLVDKIKNLIYAMGTLIRDLSIMILVGSIVGWGIMMAIPMVVAISAVVLYFAGFAILLNKMKITEEMMNKASGIIDVLSGMSINLIKVAGLMIALAIPAVIIWGFAGKIFAGFITMFAVMMIIVSSFALMSMIKADRIKEASGIVEILHNIMINLTILAGMIAVLGAILWLLPSSLYAYVMIYIGLIYMMISALSAFTNKFKDKMKAISDHIDQINDIVEKIGISVAYMTIIAIVAPVGIVAIGVISLYLISIIYFIKLAYVVTSLLSDKMFQSLTSSLDNIESLLWTMVKITLLMAAITATVGLIGYAVSQVGAEPFLIGLGIAIGAIIIIAGLYAIIGIFDKWIRRGINIMQSIALTVALITAIVASVVLLAVLIQNQDRDKFNEALLIVGMIFLGFIALSAVLSVFARPIILGALLMPIVAVSILGTAALVILIALGLKLLEKINLNEELIRNNVRKVIDISLSIIHDLFFKPLGMEINESDGFWQRLLKGVASATGSVGMIIMGIAASAFLAITIISICMIYLIARMLKGIQNLDIDTDKVRDNVDLILNSIIDIITLMNTTLPDFNSSDGKKRGIIGSIIQWISPGVANMINAIASIDFLGISYMSVSIVSKIAQLLGDISKVEISTDASAKVNMVVSESVKIARLILDNKSIDFTRKEVKKITRYSEVMTSIYGALSAFPVDAGSDIYNNIMNNISPSVDASLAMINKIADKKYDNKTYNKAATFRNICRVISEIKFAETNKETADNIERNVGNYIKFIDKVNSVKIESVKSVTNLFEKMAKFSESIRGDFDRLADALGEKIYPILAEIKTILDIIPARIDNSGAQLSSSIYANAQGTPKTYDDMVAQVKRENPDADDAEVDKIAKERLEEITTSIESKLDDLLDILNSREGIKVRFDA